MFRRTHFLVSDHNVSVAWSRAMGRRSVPPKWRDEGRRHKSLEYLVILKIARWHAVCFTHSRMDHRSSCRGLCASRIFVCERLQTLVARETCIFQLTFVRSNPGLIISITENHDS